MIVRLRVEVMLHWSQMEHRPLQCIVAVLVLLLLVRQRQNVRKTVPGYHQNLLAVILIIPKSGNRIYILAVSFQLQYP